jgi:hypothetical protein
MTRRKAGNPYADHDALQHIHLGPCIERARPGAHVLHEVTVIDTTRDRVCVMSHVEWGPSVQSWIRGSDFLKAYFQYPERGNQ